MSSSGGGMVDVAPTQILQSDSLFSVWSHDVVFKWEVLTNR